MKILSHLAAAGAITLASCAAPMALGPRPEAQADLVTTAGARAGSAAIAASAGRTTLSVELTGLAPGEHGMHFHATGRCDLPGFTTAGAHLNPHGRQHGAANPQGKHFGDLPNLVADANGRAAAVVPLDGVASELQAALFDADGTALVIHARADDYRTDPSGNSGERIACGVLRRP